MTGDASELRGRYVEQIRRNGAALTPELAAAFAAVPREAFVGGGFQRRNGTWVEPGDADFLATVYRDDVLVTKLNGRTPVSSSSQPSLMAIMLAALDVQPGQRILEIGAGTGYNAALLATLGATVTSVDVQADVADHARSALESAGVDGVQVIHGDGYAGVSGAHFDRVIVTVGVAGLSPHWLAQLEPAGGGLVVVPVEHAGTHPVLVVHGGGDGDVTGTVVCPSGFMSAAGPLTADHPGAHPAPAAAGSLTTFAEVAGARWDPPLDSPAYRDLWYAAGIWSRRATHAAVPGRDQSVLALLDQSRTGGAVIMSDGTVLAGGAQAGRYSAAAAEILDRWDAKKHPVMQAWGITLALTGDPEFPIWVPHRWELP